MLTPLSRYALVMVADMWSKMCFLLSRLARLKSKIGKVSMLKGLIEIHNPMIHVQSVEEDNLKEKEDFFNKSSKTTNNESLQEKVGNVNRSSMYQRLSETDPFSASDYLPNR